MATYRSLCKYRFVLSGRDPVGFVLVFRCEIEREGTLDWYFNRLYSTNNSPCGCHFLHKLGTRGIRLLLFYSY